MKNTDVHAGQIAYEGYSQTFYLDVLETVPAFSYIPQLFRMEGDYLTYDDGTVQGHLGVDVSSSRGRSTGSRRPMPVWSSLSSG